MTAPLTPDQHAERLREALRLFRANGYVHLEAVQSLDALLALLAEAEQRAEDADRLCSRAHAMHENAEARVAELEAALRELFDYTIKLEGMHGVAVAVRGASYPEGAKELGERVRAALGEPSQ